ncbi:YifB family Mg chelatase-like AAA ATPase [Corynebacterium dentalis]|uniref:YifB family Mg chelatase-like AAA ATPase n=1 Tax=Corynebacterium dentalis TaxID=2014528 RepID=UPI00289CD14B|nr:YifB family Mg chelatase-like AAA ATPase [Corynebacterium dentalis]
MGVGYAWAMALEGLEGLAVRVECDLGMGLPGISVIGMGDAAVVQARDRVRAALNNSGLQWPGQKVVMSLSPAGVPKHGARYDLAMVCAMLAARTTKAGMQERLKSAVLVGELGLDGRLRPVSGVLPSAVAASRRGFHCMVVPEANYAEAAHVAELVRDVRIWVAGALVDVVRWMRTGEGLMEAREFAQLMGQDANSQGVGGQGTDRQGAEGMHAQEPNRSASSWRGHTGDAPDMADVASQPEARRALEVAAAGRHNLMLLGPPGTGKSMLAQRLPGILPELTTHELLESAALHSIAGGNSQMHQIFLGRRPFIAPHHTVTQAGLIGGGARPKPGAVSLAHHGVLFLDEIPEVARAVVDTLRVPMETQYVELTRQQRTWKFPAKFQLVCAANPCPCGAEFDTQCTCASGIRARYQSKLSGPLRDRIDIFARTRSNKLASLRPGGEESSASVRQRVVEADGRARARWAGVDKEGTYKHAVNANIPGKVMRKDAPAEDEGMWALQDLLRRGTLSQRGVDRALRVSWTLADLHGKTRPGAAEILDAVEMYSDDSE